MSYDQEPLSAMFRIDVSADAAAASPSVPAERVVISLLQQLISTTHQQNKLLETLVQQNAQVHQQRASELQQWRNANPALSRACRAAAETLSAVQTQFLENLTEEISDSGDHLIEGDYMMNEFVDRFGPRMAHLNGILQVLAQLGTDTATASQQPQR